MTIIKIEKKKLHEASLKAKKENPKSKWKSFTGFVLPQKIDEETQLHVTSRETARYLRSAQIQLGMRGRLDRKLEDALNTLKNNIAATKLTKSEEKDAPPVAKQKSDEFNTFQHAPLPNPASPLHNDDAVTAVLNFVNTFFLFFDRDLMAKRPFVAMTFFSIPFMQIALPVLASNGLLPALCTKLSAALYSLEANAAKYSGVNALLHAAGAQPITAANIKETIDLVRQGAEWFTMAEGLIEQTLLGLVVAKITYNIGDFLVNGLLGDKDSVLLSEFLTTLCPGVSGSLEGKTLAEKAKGIASALLTGTLQLGAAAFIVGGLEQLSPAIKMVLSELANVPWEQLTNPHLTDIRFLQTIGVSKASATILFKMYGILGKVEAGQLVDIDGHRVRKESNSFKVLELFNQLTHCSAENRAALLNTMDKKAFHTALEHFQELLSHNPSLWEAYKNKDGSYSALKDLGVEKIVPKRRHKYSMGILKAIPTIINLVVGLIPATVVTLPVLLGGALLDKAPHDLLPEWAKPIYRSGLESLYLLSKLPKAVWTLGKSVLHSFASFAVRTPEIVASVPFVAVSIPVTILRVLDLPINYFFEKRPFARLAKGIVTANATVTGAVRDTFRYPVEEAVSFVLRKGRNLFVRKMEREMQVFAAAEKPNVAEELAKEVAEEKKAGSTFNALKTLKKNAPEANNALFVVQDANKSTAVASSNPVKPVEPPRVSQVGQFATRHSINNSVGIGDAVIHAGELVTNAAGAAATVAGAAAGIVMLN